AMATRDPLTLIRQQARYGVADIQDACRLRGESFEPVVWPKPEPLEALYPPRLLTWADTAAEALPELSQPAGSLKQLLGPANCRNLNLAQIRGADHMMIHHVAETEQAFANLASAQLHAASLDCLQSPYPFANYLAAKSLAEHGDRAAIPELVAQLDVCTKAQ